jgi:hypothetical protein
VYRSEDFGNSWTQTTEQFSINGGPYLVAPRDGSALVYCVFYDIYWENECHRSTDAGSSWTALPCYSATFVVSHDFDLLPADPMNRCVLFGDDEIGRWHDGDPLPSWVGLHETIGVEMPAWAPECAFIAGKDSAGRLQAAWRTWGGSAWLPLNDGFPSNPGPGVDWLYWYYHLEAAPGMPRLFYATCNGGLWMRDVEEVVAGFEESGLARLALAPVQPNPASGPVTFRLEGAVAGVTGWRVLDAAGRCVFRASDAADRSLVWDGRRSDGRKVPAGVYWVRAELPAGSATRSFVILR